ncbi:MAG TPA: alpha/beta-type small acid-soluble spore protein [Thermaerobacter sp.]
MARGQQGNRHLVPGAARALDQFKYEVARELGIQIPPDGYWGDMPTRLTGAVGGHMVRRMIALAEQQLAQRGGTLPPADITRGAAGAPAFGSTAWPGRSDAFQQTPRV